MRCLHPYFVAIFLLAAAAFAQIPQDDPFTIRRQAAPPGPQITAYLQYQVDQAWRLDEKRQAEFASVRTESELRQLQTRLRDRLLSMIGGLPGGKTPLNARVTGAIQRPGYRIEKVIVESLPGFQVTALLYLPDNPSGRKPAVLVPCGHSQNGKIYYQYICSRLARLGYIALTWDPVGQGERSQFWDASSKRSRYNLVCGEHAVLGNAAYLAGTNLARWEIWDGIRALDYLLTRPEVDGSRIAVTGTSGGGFQAAHLGALDSRIGVVVPSCYISSLPMRMANRIFKDPDSDPEQDLYGMISEGIDHAGLLILVYPRPLFVASAVEDFFPIEGTRKTMREVSALYQRLGRPDLVGRVEGYHGHQYSPGNLLAAFNFMNRFCGLPIAEVLPAEDKIADAELICTRSGQVRLDFPEGESLMDLIREYYLENKGRRTISIRSLYRTTNYPGIDRWPIVSYSGYAPANRIAWQAMGTSTLDGCEITRYLLHHSGNLAIPLLHIRRSSSTPAQTVLWFSDHGKTTASDWHEIRHYVQSGMQVLSFDFRGQGEDQMRYTAVSIDDPSLAAVEYEKAFVSPLSGVLANYVYSSLLTGRPYFLQMIEDTEIVARFSREKLGARDLEIDGAGDAYTLAAAAVEAIPGITLRSRAGARKLLWSEIVEQKLELWPIQYLLPGGVYAK